MLTEGETVYVKLVGLERGKFKLSMRVVDQETGEDLDPENAQFPPREDKGDRGGRDNRRKKRA